METAQLDRTETMPIGDDAFELDISIVESSPDLDKIIYDTSDNCGQSCQSACTSCP